MIELDFSRRLRPLAFCAPVFVLAFSLTGCATRATKGVFVPSERVLKWAEDGESESQCKIGWLYLGDENFAEAAKWLSRAADNGNVNSTGAAAKLFLEGLGVPKDVERGIRYLRQGAERPGGGGNENCARDLAEIYEQGMLVPRDHAEAYYFFGIALAQCGWEGEWKERRQITRRRTALGKRLSPQVRTAQDYRLFQWVDPMKNSGCEWLTYVVVDPCETAKWFQESAEKGNTCAQAELARIRVEGRGVPANVSRGVSELRRLATVPRASLDAPSNHASIYLAELYANGRLVCRDYAEAYYYYGLGIVDGYFEADVIARRRAIGSKLTADDREAQDKRLRDWITDRKAKGYQVFGESEFASSDN